MSDNGLIEPYDEDGSSALLRQYKLQEQLYASNNTGLVCNDTVKRVRDYIGNQTYRHVKFSSEVGKDFDEPDFVGGVKNLSNGGSVKIQCVEICQYLMKKIGKSYHRFLLLLLIERSNFYCFCYNVLEGEGGKTEFSLSEKILFWKRYHNIVKTKLQSKRNGNIRQMKERFMDGKIYNAFYLMTLFFFLNISCFSFQVYLFISQKASKRARAMAS